jgi:predicted dithiol-disulfide oxidoreductase (DUF899 family)
MHHFMHGPKTPEGRPGCTFETDNLVGAVAHLAHRDVTFLLASRSPLGVLNAYKARMGWEIVVYHAYSTYDRGTDALNATWQLLDRAPKGRGENFDGWPRKRDEYATA